LIASMTAGMDGPQYRAPAGSAKSWIMSTTTSARLPVDPAMNARLSLEERADRRGGLDGELVIRENDAERLRHRLVDERDAVVGERKDHDRVAQGTSLGTPRGHVLVQRDGEVGDRGGIAGEGMDRALDGDAHRAR